MFGLTRWSPFEELLNFQREVDRLFNQFWSDLPARIPASQWPSFEVNSTDDGWRVNVPIPGIDPQHVTLEVTGNTLSLKAEEPQEGKEGRVTRYEQTLTVPQFLDLDKVKASYRHGMLELTIPLKEEVKPRRIEIQSSGEERKQLAATAA